MSGDGRGGPPLRICHLLLPALALASGLPLGCTGACADLTERARGFFDDEAATPPPATDAAAVRADAGPPAPREVQAAPALRQIALQCRRTVALPLRAGMASYLESVERTGLADGHKLAVPPELAVEIESCRNGARDVQELPCDAELQAAWQAFLEVMGELEPVLGELSTYYRGLRYMDDGMQQAAPLHERLTTRHADLDRSDRRLAGLLWEAQSSALRERRERTRGDPAQRTQWITAQTGLAAIELLQAVQSRERGDPKKRLAQLAGWRAGLERFATDNPIEFPAQLPEPTLAPRVRAAAAQVEKAGLQAIGDGRSHGGRGEAIDALEQAVLELALVDGELR